MSQPLQPTPCQMAQPMQLSQPMVTDSPQSIRSEPVQSVLMEPSQDAATQALEQRDQVQVGESLMSDKKDSEKIIEVSQANVETASPQGNEENIEPQPLVESIVAAQPEILPVTNEPVAELEPPLEAPNLEKEMKNVPEPPEEALSNEVKAADPEPETTKETTSIEPPLIANNSETIVVPPKGIENDIDVEQTDVKQTEINVLPDKPVIEEAAA